MEGYSAALYCGDGICSASIGENPSTCPMDCPPAASIILDASPSIVAPDGVSYSTITATVRDRNGQLMSNMEVVFTSTIGKFSSYTAVTSSGKARVNITSAQAGVATVTGIVPSVSNTTTVKFYYVPSSITLSHSLTAPCSNKSQVVATVRDQGGNRIQDMEVVFSHDATGIASLTPASDVTNSSGKANTIFYDSKLISEKVNLTATAYMPELGITLTNSTVLDYTPSSIVLSSSRAPLVCGKDFGVTAHVVDRYGNAACGCDILFTHNATGAASLNPTSNTTNSLGDVTSLFLHDKDEEVKVEAKVNMPGAAFGLSGSAVVNPGAPIVLMDDWVIDTNVVCSDVTIIGYKFINIIDGGSLTLRCDDLQINNTASEYDFIHDNCVPTGIFVQDGGSLIIGKDASGCGVNITNVYPEGPDWMTPRRCGFAFEVYPGSDFHMSDTYLDFVFGSGTELVIKADYATVTNSVITRAYGDGIVIGGTAYDTFGSTKGVVISGNTIYNTTGYGIILDCYTNSNTISNNVIHDFGKCAISISMSGPYPWDLYNPNRIGGNTVSGNSIDGTAQSVYSFGSESVGICVSSSSGNTISSNIITNTRIGIELMNSYDYANNNILSNTLIHNRYTGSDCRNSGEDDGNGIVLISSETAKGGVNSTITGNTIAECENHGVRCINWGGGISNSTFSNNVGYENKDDCDDCLNCVIGSIGPP
jgi:parallel beta-helix repeat protein